MNAITSHVEEKQADAAAASADAPAAESTVTGDTGGQGSTEGANV